MGTPAALSISSEVEWSRVAMATASRGGRVGGSAVKWELSNGKCAVPLLNLAGAFIKSESISYAV